MSPSPHKGQEAPCHPLHPIASTVFVSTKFTTSNPHPYHSSHTQSRLRWFSCPNALIIFSPSRSAASPLRIFVPLLASMASKFLTVAPCPQIVPCLTSVKVA